MKICNTRKPNKHHKKIKKLMFQTDSSEQIQINETVQHTYFKADRLQMIVVAKNLSVLQLFIIIHTFDKMGAPCTPER